MNKLSQLVQSVTKSPFLWGILGAAGFYGLIYGIPPDVPGMPFVLRYFTHHPVEYMETVMFSIGLAALVVKIFDIAAQRSGLKAPHSGRHRRRRSRAKNASTLLARLDDLPGRRQGEYYIARLRAALQHVRRHGSADALDDELRYLSDMDAARLHAGYGLFRVIVWAIPILGFLGTVIGITMALNSIDMQSPDKSMLRVLNGLGLKFDTTALALTLSMVLMFIHFYVEQAENSLLDQVDRQCTTSWRADSPPRGPANADGQFAAVRRMAEAMMQATDCWSSVRPSFGRRRSIRPPGNGQNVGNGGRHVQTAMSAATGELARQTDVLQSAVEAAGEVTRLEDALNRNLAALSGAKHFEQTVLSLAAAVNMLSARLAESPNASDSVGIHATLGSRGMKFTLRPQRRHAARSGPGISLFPFLAVLICTMGALVPLLLAMMHTAHDQAEAAAAGQGGGICRPIQRRAAGAARRRAVAHRANEKLARANPIAVGRRPARIGPLRRPLAAIAGKLEHIEKTVAEFENIENADRQQHGQSEADLRATARQIGAARQQLDRGPQERRRPQPLVCRGSLRRSEPNPTPADLPRMPRRRRRAAAGRHQADRRRFQRADGPGNPLAAALRAAREHRWPNASSIRRPASRIRCCWSAPTASAPTTRPARR